MSRNIWWVFDNIPLHNTIISVNLLICHSTKHSITTFIYEIITILLVLWEVNELWLKERELTDKMDYFCYMVTISSIFLKIDMASRLSMLNSLLNIQIKLFSVESINFSKRYWVRNKAEKKFWLQKWH